MSEVRANGSTIGDPLPIYLDYGATTPTDPRVVQAMLPWLGAHFGNPASRSHAWGWAASQAVEIARAQVAALVGADTQEIIWTSGATESNNLALKGAALAHCARGRHLVSVQTEHNAVLDSLHALQREGFEVSLLGVRGDGLIDPQAFADALRPDTTVASVMLVNNEIGVVQDVQTLGHLCRERGVLLHVDAAQATGKVAIDLKSLPVDLMSLTAHKSYGPKGVGALYVRRRPRVRLVAQMDGGGQERGLRSGTLATHQVVGMGEAFRLAGVEWDTDAAHASALHQRLLSGLTGVEGLILNGHAVQRVPHNVNLSVAGVEGEALLLGLRGLALSSGSACHSASQQPSHVLRALGRSDELAHASLRISFGRFTTEAEIDRAADDIRATARRLRHAA